MIIVNNHCSHARYQLNVMVVIMMVLVSVLDLEMRNDKAIIIQ